MPLLADFPNARSNWRRLAAVLALTACGHAAAELVLYEDDDYSGRPYRAYGATVNLDRVGFNDRASSAVVRSGSWQL